MMKNYKLLLSFLGFIFIGIGVKNYFFSAENSPSQSGKSIVSVKPITTFSDKAGEGQKIFNTNCAYCHGVNASGVEGAGPPLVHKIYEPNHHSDQSFYMAVANGVRAHHWRFGNMPPVQGVHQEDVTKIIAYVRQLQKENGIW